MEEEETFFVPYHAWVRERHRSPMEDNFFYDYHPRVLLLLLLKGTTF